MHKSILNKKAKVVLSPHYDDFPLTIGGLAKKWSERNIPVVDYVMFSRSKHTLGSGGNRYISSESAVSRMRLNEERKTARHLGNVQIKLAGLPEAPLRGHRFLSSERYKITTKLKHMIKQFLMPIDKDKERKAKLKVEDIVKKLLTQPVQLFVLLAIKHHVDHALVRNAVIRQIQANRKKIKAEVYFCEDLPYAAKAARKDWKDIRDFIKAHALKPITYPIDVDFKLKLLKFYTSQMDSSFYSAVQKRAREIQQQERSKAPQEKIYFMPLD